MKRAITLTALLLGAFFILPAQDSGDSYSPTTNLSDGPAWEIGVHAGHLFSAGNIDFIPGYGGGIHIRRSLDYVFSLRLDLNYGQPKGEDPGNVRSYEGTWMSGSLQAIASLNNLKWDLGERKTNFYVLGGIGLNNFESEVTENDVVGPKIEADIAPHVDLGAGVSFRINEKVNISLEHKALLVLGKRADLIDGVATFIPNEDRSTFRDVMNYTSVRVNINLIGKNNKTEPLYWLNPLDAVLADVQKLKDTRVTLRDEDGDGVIDMLDNEEETPAGAAVDSKGVTLDSDKDGIANHEDQEPYSPSGYEINAEGVAQVPNIMEQAAALIDEKLKDFQPKTTEVETAKAGPVSWFLPSIYFGANATAIAIEDYAKLANIAEVMKSNSDLKFAVTGHTDDSGSVDYNNSLSYTRALSVVNHLVEKNGVSRSQLILGWKGESENLVVGTYQVNRRVGFKVATTETEMSDPASNE